MRWASPNFAFLEQHDPLLHRYASLAERYFAEDPNEEPMEALLARIRELAQPPPARRPRARA